MQTQDALEDLPQALAMQNLLNQRCTFVREMAIPNLFMCAQSAPKDFHFHEELSSPMQCKT